MKCGVLQFFSWPQRRTTLSTVYDRAMERIQRMDEAGYDCVWLAEHHFADYSVCPSVHMMGVHVAARTRRIRIGTAVSLAGMYHPLRLAEEVAFLDVLSGGRVNWGAGRGFDPVEFAAFGVKVEDSGRRFHEAVRIVERAWCEPRLSWAGEFWSFDNIEVLPKPLQQPHPPIWLAAGSDGAVRWAAKHGYSVMLGSHATFDELAGHLADYARELDTNGHRRGARDLPIARFVAVGDNDAEAAQIASEGARWLIGAYMNPGKATRPDLKAQDILTMDPETKIRRYLESVIIHGSPERVVEQIERLRSEIALEYLMIAPLSHGSFMRFTERVLPRLIG